MRLLRWLPPEVAHSVGVAFLQLYQWIWFQLCRRRLPAAHIHIRSVPQISFRNRLGLAAGFDKDAQVFAAAGLLGFGFVEVGTVTPQPQIGNAKPRLWRLGGEGLVNQMGFNNVGADRFCENLRRYRERAQGVVLFANVGKGRATSNEFAVGDYVATAQAVSPWVDGIVVNLSSPNTPGLRDLQTEQFVERLAAHLPKLPVFIKFAPDLEDAKLGSLLEQVGRIDAFTGVVLTNTSIRLAQLAGKDRGGYSGPKLFERSLECVTRAREILPDSKWILGVGGVSSPAQALAMRKAGADLIEIYTSFVYQGPGLVSKLAAALEDNG